MFEVVDISDWKLIHPIPALGYMEKLWLKHPETNIAWLMKYSSDPDQPVSDNNFPSDAINEKLASEIAKLFSIPAHQVELAVDDEGQWGVICKNFLKPEEKLSHGGQYLSTKLGVLQSSPDFKEVTRAYTLQFILETLPHIEEDLIIQLFLMNLIGNIDMHDKNWALLRYENKLAPAYDMGISFVETTFKGEGWFQQIGWEEGPTSNNFNLWEKLSQNFRTILQPYMEKLKSEQIVESFSHVLSKVPEEFRVVMKHQEEFLQKRREKMIKIWEVNDGKDSLLEDVFSDSNAFGG